ncbi:GTP cyclohydrolase II [Rhizobium oryziradicis]|uniref:GTP cyclohydrolase-2 n=1 Tax=Rhizobium oryziradicis TaxID=1867956 RepID=A0A1Q8ZVT2_9HYPH|nr:GTP cyclohydrolase II [Rhizobium oryziradicis]OLP46162.1 GTP cyclohydrolase II [Rhizobium oryziradicis]
MNVQGNIKDAVQPLSEAMIPTQDGQYRMIVFQDEQTAQEHVAMVMGEIDSAKPTLVRLHSECMTGDLFGSYRCDCGEQLAGARQRIAEEGAGIILYFRQEGRGIGLANKLRAYALQDQGHDTVDANLLLGFAADQRSFDSAAAMLMHLGVRMVTLMTNNPRKIEALQALGIAVVERLPLHPAPRPENHHYLATKALKLGHRLEGMDSL